MDFSVGVVIPTYNRPLETLRAVKSVLSQSLKVSEIVIVDDGSHEANLDQLRSSLLQYEIEVLALPHSGKPGLARNEGIKRLNTKYVAFLDSDDQWLEDKIERQIELLNKTGGKAACTNASVLDNSSTILPYQSFAGEVISFRDLVRSNSIICSSALVERELLLECGGFADNSAVQGAEDYATWLRVSSYCSWKYISEPMVIYSRETFSHFSDNSKSRPEIKAYLDFISWRYSSLKESEVKTRLFLHVLRTIVSRFGK